MQADRSQRILPRSYLYCPADRADWLAGADRWQPDAVIADLEDAVAPSRKDDARATAASWLATRDGSAAQAWVRVNAGMLEQDIGAVAPVGPAGLVVAKAEVSLLAQADELLTASERAADLPAGGIRLLPLIETATGLLSAPQLAAAARVIRLGIGEADLAAELGAEAGNVAALAPIRMQVVVASAAAGIVGPVGAASIDFRDADALRTGTDELRALGFRARTAIHPSQVAVINAVFTPSAQEVQQARELLAAGREAAKSGRGAATGPDGRMLDAAVLRSARDIVARAGLD